MGTGQFTQAVQASFPAGITLPPPLAEALDWLDEHGHVLQTRTGPVATLLSPAEREGSVGAGGAAFHPVPGDFGHWWLASDDPRVTGRLAAFVATGADGSEAGIWVDDAGRQQFVHLGSGSGSIWSGVVTADPVDFLRLLAIGYDELCWPEHHEVGPAQAYAAEDGPAGGWAAPAAFRTWLTGRFGVTVPATAREVVPVPDDRDGNRADDPFGAWLDLGR